MTWIAPNTPLYPYPMTPNPYGATASYPATASIYPAATPAQAVASSFSPYYTPTAYNYPTAYSMPTIPAQPVYWPSQVVQQPQVAYPPAEFTQSVFQLPNDQFTPSYPANNDYVPAPNQVTVIDEPLPSPTLLTPPGETSQPASPADNPFLKTAKVAEESNGPVTPNKLRQSHLKNRQSSLTQEQQFDLAKENFYKLVDNTRNDKQALLNDIQKMDVKVLDSDQTPWVADVLEKTGSPGNTLLLVPTSFLFDEAGTHSNPIGPKTVPEWVAVQKQAEKLKQPVLLVNRRKADIGMILKQAFMLEQIKQGLPTTGDSPKATEEAMEFLHQLTHHQPWYKRFSNRFIKAPWIRFKRNFSRAKPKPDGPGHALRMMMKRYIDTNRELLLQRKKLNLSKATISYLKRQTRQAKYYTTLSYNLK